MKNKSEKPSSAAADSPPSESAATLTPDELAFLELLKKDLKFQEDLDSMHYETVLAKSPSISPAAT